MSFFDLTYVRFEHGAIYKTCLKNQNQQNLSTNIKLKLETQLKLEVAAIFLKNCKEEIMIDQNALKIHEEIMKFSFLENFEAFRLQLLYWCCSIVFCTFNLKLGRNEKNFS